MPKRARMVTMVPTPEVQPPDGWVKVRKVTIAEREVLTLKTKQFMERVREEAKAAQGDGDSEEGMGELFDALTSNVIAMDIQLETDRFLVEQLADHIVEWNWCDEDGEPFPQVSDDPAILKQLTPEELYTLRDAMGAPEVVDEKAKNSGDDSTSDG